MSVTLLRGNALALPLADDSVDLIVTSPPYFGLRSYTDGGEHYAGQIGSEPTPAEFLDALVAATREMVRVLKPSGSLWINLGDKYNSAASGQNGTGRTGLTGPHDRMPGRGATVGGYPAKSLLGIPWRYALRCIGHGTALADPEVVRLLLREVAAGVLPLWAAEQLAAELAATPDEGLGLILRAEVIWSKPNGLPESVTDRVRRSHEQWFHFTKAPRYFAAVDEIREPQATLGERHVGRSGWKDGHPSKDRAGFSERALSPLGKLPGSVWTIPTQPLTVPPELGIDHFAAFPMEWPRRLIIGWSPPGICTECGEGRRPVADVRYLSIGDTFAGGTAVAGRHRSGKRMGDGALATIVGYACACTPYTDHPERRQPSATPRGEDLRASMPATGEQHAWPERRPVREYHFDRWTPAPTRPAVVLDPFSGTGTVALVADMLGRHGIGVDMSRDYCRLAQWRTADPGQRAAAAQVPKPPVVPAEQEALWG